jgi:hypothetical protein
VKRLAPDAPGTTPTLKEERKRQMEGQMTTAQIIVMPKRPAAKPERMTWGDYATVYARQTLAAIGDTRPAPENWWDFLERFQDRRALAEVAMNAASELFGKYPCEDGTQLFEVETLTLKEGAIAARPDLSHDEKIELIRPLREKRRIASEAAQARSDARPSRYELEYQENERRRDAEREAHIASAVAAKMAVSDEDHTWAGDMGVSLD